MLQHNHVFLYDENGTVETDTEGLSAKVLVIYISESCFVLESYLSQPSLDEGFSLSGRFSSMIGIC